MFCSNRTWDQNQYMALVSTNYYVYHEWNGNVWGRKWSRSNNCQITINSRITDECIEPHLRPIIDETRKCCGFLHKTPFIMIPIDYYWFGTNHSALQCCLKLLNGSYSAVNGLPYLTERTVELGYAQYKVIHDSARTRLMNFFDTRPIRFLPLCYTYSGCITSFGMTNRNQSTRYIQIGNRKREKFLVINWFRAWKLWKIATCIT